jgi:hypothetical protein
VRFASSSSVRPATLSARAAALCVLVAMGHAHGARAAEAPWGADRRTAAARVEASRASVAARRVNPGRGIQVVAALRPSEPKASVDALERAGYHVDVAVLPNTFFVRPLGGARSLPNGFVEATPEPMSRPQPEPVRSASADPVPLPGAETPSLLNEDPFGGRGDALPPAVGSGRGTTRGEPALSGALSGLPYGARWRDTSELMLGRVAVSILFPESDGSFDTNRYDWTPALEDSVIRSAVRGLLKWTGLASDRGVSLTFLLEIYPALPTRYEPIMHPVVDELSWIEDVLEPLVGYRGDATAMGYDLANGARARLGTQWSALVFAVQDDSSSAGRFPDGYISHAQLGGPWYIVPINNLNTKSAALDFYMEHEMTHMFWALDEFPASYAWWSCTLTTGYFNQQNQNSVLPGPGYCGPNVQCLMTGNYPDSVCAPTLRQIGWVDKDQSGVLDLFETKPLVVPDSMRYVAAVGVPIPVRATALDEALPNENPYWYGAGDSITVATIDSTWYRVDGGSWIPIVPDDGIYDEGAERFRILVPSPGLGEHKLEFQALNSNGFESATPASVTLSITGGSSAGGGAAGPSAPSLTVGPTPSGGSVRFRLEARVGANASARLYDIGGRVVRSWAFQLPATGRFEWEWDGRTDRGSVNGGGLYFVVARIGGERLTRRVLLLRR